MTKFILFIYLSTYSASGGVAIATAEFNSLEKCTIAGQKVQKKFNGFAIQKPKYFCTEK